MKTIDFNQPVGLALGSGAARGLAHIGVLKYLEENSIDVGWIAGSSIGALVGAAYAVGISSHEMIQIIEHLDWKFMVKHFSPTFATRGMVSGHSLTSFFHSLLGDAKIEDLKIPFRAVATDIHTGERVVISKGSLVDAVRASISIPVIFQPIRIAQRTLVDGGLVDPVPVEVVKQMGATSVVAVSVSQTQGKPKVKSGNRQGQALSNAKGKTSQKMPAGMLYERMSRFLRVSGTTDSDAPNSPSSPSGEPLPNMLQIFWQTVTIAEQEITRLRLQVCPPDFVIQPDTNSMQSWEFIHALEAVKAGELAAKITFKDVVPNQRRK
ncbi:MAG: patatin-like phospholipase family protein [candidate division Zixibacteria bacterium]|nr:patatin-like phospholipase family protein [candidate division Zixibacteria bacterium]